MSHHEIVQVHFVDVSSGQVIARSNVPVAQLPQSFHVETRLDIGDAIWHVVDAEPATAIEFIVTGQLTLKLQRLQTMSSKDILFTLPTICGTELDIAPSANEASRFELHEDDWRQIELVPRLLAGAVEAELEKIRWIYQQHAKTDAQGRANAFDAIHARMLPAMPMMPYDRLSTYLPSPMHVYSGVGFARSTGMVPGSFAFGYETHVIYGRQLGAEVVVLGLHPLVPQVHPLSELMRAHDLILADWCRCTVMGGDQ